ncbi:SDR family oxidoreductase, partial [Peribacillus sp. NPDC060186]
DRANSIPVARSGMPSDIANAVAFFADEASSFVSGQVLYVAGGPKN